MKTLLTLKAVRYSSIKLYILCSKQRTWQIWRITPIKQYHTSGKGKIVVLLLGKWLISTPGYLRWGNSLHLRPLPVQMFNCISSLAFDAREGPFLRSLDDHYFIHGMDRDRHYPRWVPLQYSASLDRYHIWVHKSSQSPQNTYTTPMLIVLKFARWQFVTALDVIAEVSLFLISVYLVWSIQMSLKSKSIVISAFGCRLP